MAQGTTEAAGGPCGDRRGVRRAARERVEHLRTAHRLIDAAVSAETAEACIKSLWGALESLMRTIPRPAEMDAPATRRSLPHTIPADVDETHRDGPSPGERGPMRRGVATVRAKAAPSGGRGKFTAYVSIFGNVDMGGDRVVRGAFSKSLRKWRASGDRVPVVFSHNSHDPHQIVGSADPHLMREDERGLLVVGEFDLETETGRQVWKLVRDRVIKERSFSYLVEKERKANDDANELLVVDLIEMGPTIRGMNPDTATLSTKSLASCIACHVDGPRRRAKSADAELAEAIDAAARGCTCSRTPSRRDPARSPNREPRLTAAPLAAGQEYSSDERRSQARRSPYWREGSMIPTICQASTGRAEPLSTSGSRGTAFTRSLTIA